MNEETQQSIETITGIAERVAEAMEAAAVEYGEASIDLALLAYQVDAVKSLIIGLIFAIPILFCVRAFKWLWAFSDGFEDITDRQMLRTFFSVAYVLVSIIALVGVVDHLLNPVMWLAAFGKPELMIATKALQASGLL